MAKPRTPPFVGMSISDTPLQCVLTAFHYYRLAMKAKNETAEKFAANILEKPLDIKRVSIYNKCVAEMKGGV